MCTCQEGIREILQGIHDNVFAHYDCFTVGEGSGITSANAADYIGQSQRQVDSVHHFQLSSRKRGAFTPAEFRKIQTEWAEVMKHNAWPTQFLSNHDQPRQVSHHGNDTTYRVESAKLDKVTYTPSPYIPLPDELKPVIQPRKK